MNWTNDHEPRIIKSEPRNTRGHTTFTGIVRARGYSTKIYGKYPEAPTSRRFYSVELPDGSEVKLMVAEAVYQNNFEHAPILIQVIEGNDHQVGDKVSFQARADKVASGWVWTDWMGSAVEVETSDQDDEALAVAREEAENMREEQNERIEKMKIEAEFVRLSNGLSPENLWCDGEATEAQARATERKIRKEWADLEKIYGKKVTEAEAWGFYEAGVLKVLTLRN